MIRALGRGNLATWLALCASVGVACGVSDRKVQEQSSGGSAGFVHSTGGSAGEAGSESGGIATGGREASVEAGNGGSGGEGTTPTTPGCDPACSGETPVCVDEVCVACNTASKKCDGDVPLSCEDGVWVAGDACTSSTPACSNGVCAAVKLKGGFVSVGPAANSPEGLRLRNASFTELSRSCGKVGGKELCVKGSIR